MAIIVVSYSAIRGSAVRRKRLQRESVEEPVIVPTSPGFLAEMRRRNKESDEN